MPWLSRIDWTYIIHALIALLVIITWEGLGVREFTLEAIHTLRRRRTWKRLLALQGDVFVAKSTILHDGDKETIRRSDSDVEHMLLQRVESSVQVLATDPGFTKDRASAHFIVIGSPKHTQRARDLQHWYQMPHEYVFDYFHADPPRRLLKIASANGQEFASSRDVRGKQGAGSIDYGLLMSAMIPERKRLFWLSGIHGAGTLGVADYLLRHPDEFLLDEPSSGTWARQWLFRIEYDDSLPESRKMISSVEKLTGPRLCQLRTIKQPVRAVICDFGNVLMAFDRDRTYRALAHVTKRPFKDVADLINNSQAQKRYERGELDDRGFFEVIRELFDSSAAFDYDDFAEWWGDIFWENRSVVELFREIRDQVALVMLSNTNGLHMASVREHYPDILALFNAHVLSYEEKRTKPAAELFQRAIVCAGTDVRPEECIYIDDIPTYVDSARKLGMQGLLYYNYAELVRGLRAAGIRIT